MLRVLYLWLAGIVIFYGGWLFVASFEARVALPPIWGGQYRAWFPGDLFLLVLLAVAVVYCTEHVSVSGWTTLLGLVLGLIVGLAMFRYQITPPELADQWLMFSPTRILHQVVIYTIGVFAFVRFVLPAAWSIVKNGIAPSAGCLVVVGVIGIVGYALCLAYDWTHPIEAWDMLHPIHAPLAEQYLTDFIKQSVATLYHLFLRMPGG